MNQFIIQTVLVDRFSHLGFQMRPGPIRNSSCLVRSSSISGLMEWIIFKSAGKQNEAVSATLSLSVTQIVPFFKLMELQPLVTVAEDDFRGTTDITDSNKANKWLVSVRSAAAVEFDKLTATRGTRLLERTTKAVKAAEQYFEKIRLMSLPDEFVRTITRYGLTPNLALSIARGDHSVVKEAERLAEFPGVLHIFGGDQIYLFVCLTILSFSKEIEGDERFFGQNPLFNDELMWRIQLVVDKLLCYQRYIPLN